MAQHIVQFLRFCAKNCKPHDTLDVKYDGKGQIISAAHYTHSKAVLYEFSAALRVFSPTCTILHRSGMHSREQPSPTPNAKWQLSSLSSDRWG